MANNNNNNYNGMAIFGVASGSFSVGSFSVGRRSVANCWADGRFSLYAFSACRWPSWHLLLLDCCFQARDSPLFRLSLERWR